MPEVKHAVEAPKGVIKELRGVLGGERMRHLVNEGFKAVVAVDKSGVRHLLSAVSGDRCTEVHVSDTPCWDGSKLETWRIRGVHHH